MSGSDSVTGELVALRAQAVRPRAPAGFLELLVRDREHPLVHVTVHPLDGPAIPELPWQAVGELVRCTGSWSPPGDGASHMIATAIEVLP